MKISKIEVQKRNKKRVSIFIDGEYRFSLSQDLLLKYNLQEGSVITEDEIKALILTEEKERIRKQAYRILRFRDRSSKELKERLMKLGYDPAIVEEVIQELLNDGTLDDDRFVQEFISDYTEFNPRGNRFIEQELRKRGIPAEMIERVIKTRDEKAIVQRVIQTKMKNLDKRNPKDRIKLARRLITRGFTPSIVYDVLGEDNDQSGD